MQTQTQTQNQPTQTARIVAAILDTERLKMYKPDGECIELLQGDPRIKKILDLATGSIMRNGYADVDLAEMEQPNAFREFEEQTGGLVKFFRVAKSKLLNLFGEKATATPLPPTSVGTVPQAKDKDQPEAKAEAAPVKATAEAKMEAAVADIMKHATPVSSPNFNTKGLDKQQPIEENAVTPRKPTEDKAEDTIVAVVGNKIVPGMERIETQFSRAAKLGSTKGVEKFIERLSTVLGARKHSADDLLKFMERGDLPIAEDGSILIYKVLRKKNGKYVDCHTGKVPQQVGSYVCMDPSLVDHNRNNECSNGLHVARRGYVGGFSGDVCVLAKLFPEDVIAVPSYDANKMRVCGYHIIFELSEAMYSLLKSNKPITDLPAGQELLGRALAGDHIGITEEVRITEQQGEGVVITPKGDAAKQPPVAPVEVKPVTALENPEEEVKAPPVDPKAVVNEVTTVTRKEQAAKLYADYMATEGQDTAERQKSLDTLIEFKKQAKTSWEKLGLPDLTPKPQAEAKAPTKEAKVNAQPKKTMTPREEIQHLLPKFEEAKGSAKTDLAHDILKLKKQAKKSWDVLGVSATVVQQIKLRTE